MGKPCGPDCRDSCCMYVGGIGGLTPAEDAQLVELLNGGQRCECGQCSDECSSPIVKPGIRSA